MPIVITLGKTTAITELKKSKKEIEIKRHLTKEGVPLSVFQNKSELKALLSSFDDLPKDYLESEPVYVSIAYGFGVEYTTFRISQDTVDDGTSKLKPRPQEERICNISLEHLPEGLSGAYTPAILDLRKDTNDYIVSAAYMPVTVLEELKELFKEMGINVYRIVPMGFAVSTIINPGKKQLVCDLGTEKVVLNQDGLLDWGKPVSCGLSEEEIIENLKNISKEVFSSVDYTDNTIILDENYSPYLNINISYNGRIDLMLLQAVGAILPERSKENIAEVETDEAVQPKKGGLKDAIDKLRKLFNSGRS